MRDRLNLSLPADLIGRINDIADRKGVTRSAIVEAADRVLPLARPCRHAGGRPDAPP